MQRDRAQDWFIQLGKQRRVEQSGQIAGKRGMIGLRNQPPFVCTLLLFSLHGFPSGNNSWSRTPLRFRITGLDRVENHASGYFLGVRAAFRMRIDPAAAGPVPVGGLRAPSISSLRTIALLCSSFLEAKSRVTLLLLAKRYSSANAWAAGSSASSFKYRSRNLLHSDG